MINLTVPADFNVKTIDLYNDYNCLEAKVVSTYGEINSSFSSGRAKHFIQSVDIENMRKYISYSKKKGIDFNYTLNSTCMSNVEFTDKGLNELIKFINILIGAGVDSFTVALPPLIEIIKSVDPNIIVKASTMCEINSVNKAKDYLKIGVDHIVADERINRDFPKLQQIANISPHTEVIVNSICDRDCPYRFFHQNQAAHYHEDQNKDYYLHRCTLNRFHNPGNFLRLCWIRPEDLHYYEEIGINHFKIQGRQAVLNGNIPKTVMAYLNRGFDGNLYSLLTCFQPLNKFYYHIDNKALGGYIDPFISKNNNCLSDCVKCNYCSQYALKCMDINEIRYIYNMEKHMILDLDYLKNYKRIIHNET